MSQGFPSLKKILKEGREFGVGTILSTQFLKHFGCGDDDYSKYILTWVVHNVSDLKNSEVDFVFKAETKSQENQMLFNSIKALEKHHSIIKIGNNKPVYVRDVMLSGTLNAGQSKTATTAVPNDYKKKQETGETVLLDYDSIKLFRVVEGNS